jgi:4-hydroxybenzoate polyprenyltransferase
MSWSESPVAAVVKLARPRYLALTLPPFLVGVAASPDPNALYAAMGAAAIVVLRGVSSIGNCIADRVEDEVDHPERAVLGARVGWERLGRLVRRLTVAYLVLLASMCVAIPLQPLPAAMWLSFLVLKIAYSFGPRLKPKRHTATLLLGTVSAAMLFVGWTGADMADFTEAACAGIVLWAFGASLCGSKDVPNLEGDLRAGYRSVYWDIVEGRRPLVSALLVVTRPYAVVLGAAVFTAVTGGPGLRLLWCLAAFPCAVAFVVLVVRSRSPEERSLVREYGYLYWLLSMGAVLVCFVPTPTAAALSLAAGALFVGASHLAHPDPVPALRAVRLRRLAGSNP